MKRNLFAVLAVVAVCLISSPLALAQKQAGRAEKVAEGITRMQEVLNQVKGQIDTTLTSLGALGDSQGDVVKEYEGFVKEVKKTDDMAKKARSAAEKAKGKQEEYLKANQQDQAAIQNEELKAAMEARRAELEPVIEQIRTSLTSAKDDFAPWMQDLNDLKLYLGNSLNPTGIAGAQPLIEKCNTNGAKVKADIDAANTAMSDLSGRIKPSGGGAK